MEQPASTNTRKRVSPQMADALLALLHVASELHFVDVLTLVGEIATGQAPKFRIGKLVDLDALAHEIDDRNPKPQAPTRKPSAQEGQQL